MHPNPESGAPQGRKPDGLHPAPVIHVELDEALAPMSGELPDADALRAMLERAILAALQAVGHETGELALLLTHDDEIRELNRQYRGIDAPTDVLSFPMQEPAQPDGPALIVAAEALSDTGPYLGDIVIAVPYSRRQARQFANSLQDELCLLAVHGTLHLLGYDHDTPAREAEMWALQDAILAAIGAARLSRRDFDDNG